MNGRILWLAIVLSSTAMFAWQCHDFVEHYLSRPVRLKMSISQQQPVVFPAVTICNQNTFRCVAFCTLIIWEICVTCTLLACVGEVQQSGLPFFRLVICRHILTSPLLYHPITLQEIHFSKVLSESSPITATRIEDSVRILLYPQTPYPRF